MYWLKLPSCFGLPYGYKFLRVIKFCGFQGHQPNHKKILVKFLWGYAHARTRAISGQDKLENGVTFVQPLTTAEKLLCHGMVQWYSWITCSLIHEYHHTTNLEKKDGNYTHNKSAKIKTFENLIIRMFQQKREILIPRNFVPLRYPYSCGLATPQQALNSLHNTCILKCLVVKLKASTSKVCT